MIKQEELRNAIDRLDLRDAEVCIHSSLRSFGAWIEGGISALVEAFLEAGCTLLVPTFSYGFTVRPVERYAPKQNGAGDYSWFYTWDEDRGNTFQPGCRDISAEDMGVLSRYVLEMPGSVRGNHPICSFTAVGNQARRLVSGQSWKEVFAPLEQLCEDGGYLLLMGVLLNRATLIHYAEQLAGRNPFIRWAKDGKGKTRPAATGGCSEGFENLSSYLKSYETIFTVGKSLWRCYPAAEMVERCARVIARNPQITHCGNAACDRCDDAMRGGPILKESFWD